MNKMVFSTALTSVMLLSGCSAPVESVANNKQLVLSPDGELTLTFELVDGQPYYSLTKDSELLLEPSSLGFELKDQPRLQTELKIESVQQSSVSDSWQTVWGENATIANQYNELTVSLAEQNASGRQFTLSFRVFDDGVGFQYHIPQQPGVSEIVITDELTEFNFAADYDSWWIVNDWDSYEYTYNSTPLSETESVSTPFTMRTPKGTHLTVHEAALVNYSGMALKRTGTSQFVSALAPWANSDIKVKGISQPLTSVKTPWRVILVTDSAGELAESNLVLNLNEPNKLDDVSWIQPQKYMGIWWEMHIGVSDWGRHNNNHGATTENAKKYIDFIHQHLIQGTDNKRIGLLVEGWNIGWDGQWWDNWDKFEFTESAQYSDFDLSDVIAYGDARGVDYIMHNETSGGIVNYDEQMDAAYADYQRLGIHAIKSGYVADKGMMNPNGEHHHGQYMVNHYNNAVIKAAQYQLMINTHEPIKDTGLRRTYPNWMTREGVQGQEYNAWSNGNPPEHATILPFTRNLSGPVDYTPGIFDVLIPQREDNRVYSTRAKQLALGVLYYSPLQMITDLPENYLQSNGETYPEFQFLIDLETDWERTVWLDSEIGEYASVARKAKHTDEWFLAAVTDEQPRTMVLPLSFLGQGKYQAEIYRDGDDADYETNPTSVAIETRTVSASDVVSVKLIKSGGVAVRLVPLEQ